MNYNLTNDQQRLITMYINQYNQTNNHIEQLLDMLDEIRNNIINVLSFGQPRRTRLNRHSRNSNTNINRFINQIFNERQNNFIRYDYNSPINQRVYNNANPIRTRTNILESNDLSTFFSNFLNTTVAVRPTNEQIENASRLIRYRDIENPVSESCPILLDRFQPDQTVRQIIHCGHIFCQEEFQQWFENHVQCPVCRYDIRYYRPSSRSDTNNNSSNNNSSNNSSNNNSSNNNSSNNNSSNNSSNNNSSNNNSSNSDTTEPITSNRRESVTFDMSNNEFSNNFVDNLTSNIFQSLLFPQTQNDNLFMLDPSSNILFYEAILRPNNRNNNTR